MNELESRFEIYPDRVKDYADRIGKLIHQVAKEEGLGEAVLLREALDDLLLKYGTNDIES